MVATKVPFGWRDVAGSQRLSHLSFFSGDYNYFYFVKIEQRKKERMSR